MFATQWSTRLMLVVDDSYPEAPMRCLFGIPITFLLLAVVVAACDETLPTETHPGADTDALVELDSPTYSSITDKVSAGGNDVCEAIGRANGCDGNFSLTARQYSDDNVKGQYQDTFARGGNGVHASIDCLNVVGNGAVIGGVITRGGNLGQDWTGQRFLAVVVDNGRSNSDPPDQVSFTFNDTDTDCTATVPGNFFLFDLFDGQVTVW